MRGVLAAAIIVLGGCSALPLGEPRFEVEVENLSNEPMWLEIVGADPSGIPGGPPIREPIPVPPGRGTVRFPVPPRVDYWHLRVRGQEGYFDGLELYDWSRRLAADDCSTFVLGFAENGSPYVNGDCLS